MEFADGFDPQARLLGNDLVAQQADQPFRESPPFEVGAFLYPLL
jgi:hypothetical protein